ncbi:maltose acetyltransferase domain-containing protein [Vibrio ezurae]|uniref:Maltose/galactoside acetyltransferase domain-containing protein n=1 Tax=Vibrio ezurae NBRC 102218 TaxID=1219080 RepID=U3B3D0_9VIBR|nr:maltose acetyltransferase domain-containing protein [Vibrio ezurae]GAD79972.1 hypothetical protein VEZ01S_21_00960 [Vibrio ezurae NBRC 102218]
MTEFAKMLAGEEFDGGAEGIIKIRENASSLLQAINQNTDETQRHELFQQLLGSIADRRYFLCLHSAYIASFTRSLNRC